MMQEKEYLLETAYGALARVKESEVEQFLKEDEELKRKIKNGESPATLPEPTEEELKETHDFLEMMRARRAKKK